ncbi:phosphate/sulfate permease [Halogeometricum pallidum JCM 14848]|uniref:Phosphate transporter n=1 Tax=Halogeometricum pallidum JCM 14848 TaxID=1227487 RepID=M0D6N2_HALPD|nr:inorganic phosphate transporter [Halogeometricum pallidum]ELZ31151.1 phosphate/sulfate permease [Halogeometricum pallidum JCM 14848]
MVEILLIVGLLVAVFVGFNIGGSSTGVAFGPAVGSGLLSKLAAGALMTAFALFGAWTAGREVIKTMGGQIVPQSEFTLVASVAVLFFVGLALLISNTFGVPASTSMTAVGAIAGLGIATGTLDEGVMLEIVSWWIVAPVIAFWVCAMVGRYVYPYLDAKLKLDSSPGALVELDRDGVPMPKLGPNTTVREAASTVLVVVIACYMAYSAGASNAANAVAPLVGNGALGINEGILLSAGAIGLGAFTIARRTLDTVGNDLTELPILAALIVETVSASLITFLSYIGIPASLAVSATMCIVGLGWGRATRTVTIGEAISGKSPGMSVNALTAETREDVPPVGEESETDLAGSDLFDPGTTGRVIFFWLLTPSLSAVASYALFSATPL